MYVCMYLLMSPNVTNVTSLATVAPWLRTPNIRQRVKASKRQSGEVAKVAKKSGKEKVLRKAQRRPSILCAPAKVWCPLRETVLTQGDQASPPDRVQRAQSQQRKDKGVCPRPSSCCGEWGTTPAGDVGTSHPWSQL